MSVSLAVIIGLIAALVLTVLVYIFILPERARKRLAPILQFVHDLIHFRTMLIESISKLLYVFCTFGCIVAGILLLFVPNVLAGLLVLIAGPLVLRIMYEMIMLYVLHVQNLISLNRKMK